MWIITASLFTFAWLDQVDCEAASLRIMFPLGFPLQRRDAVMNTQNYSHLSVHFWTLLFSC